MAIQIKVPAVGESITEVTIANWLKKDGDMVKLDEVIAELESDKATFELTATSDGILRMVKRQGSTVSIGELLCEIDPFAQAVGANQHPTFGLGKLGDPIFAFDGRQVAGHGDHLHPLQLVPQRCRHVFGCGDEPAEQNWMEPVLEDRLDERDRLL